MDADLIYNVGDSKINEAAIVFDPDHPLDVEWPINATIDDASAINQALAIQYSNYQLRALPGIYPVKDDGGRIGYIVTERLTPDPTDDELYETFWRILEKQNLAEITGEDDENWVTNAEFLQPTPFACDGMWDQSVVGVVAHKQVGCNFPVQHVSRAIDNLVRQQNWYPEDYLYIYPIYKGEDALLSGLWIATAQENLGDDQSLDDAFLRRMTSRIDFNNPQQYPQPFRPERIQWQ